jgi:hypothetical protein
MTLGLLPELPETQRPDLPSILLFAVAKSSSRLMGIEPMVPT